VFERRIPEWVRHAPVAGASGFAVLSALDAGARAILVSVFPLLMYRTLGSAERVSAIYLTVGMVALAAALLIPWAMRRVPRRWMFTTGALTYALGAALVLVGGVAASPFALMLCSVASVTVFVCLNAYVLDYIGQAELRRCETLRMFYSALAWSVGPFLGVWLLSVWTPLPFLVSAVFGVVLCLVFWRMRLGNGRLIRRSRAPATNPLAYIARFASQPRLVAGYLFAMLRSCGWWVYVVYLPIFAIQSGLGDRTGGIALSLTNSLLFLTPLMLRWTRPRPVRMAVRTGFLWSACLFTAATVFHASPWLALSCLFLGSAFLVLLDISGGLPFLMAVKPSERTEMSAIYSSFRDVSGILTPGIASVVLLFAPVYGLFAAAGVGLFVGWGIAGRIPQRLGAARVIPGAVTR
jgi:MFS family permease